MRVAVCQILQNYDCDANLKRAVVQVEAAADCDMVVLPEMFITPFEHDAICRADAHATEALEIMQHLAHKHSIYLLAGTLPVVVDGRRYNRAHIIGPDGEIIDHYDKMHLFDCTPPDFKPIKESDTFTPGSRLVSFDTPWGRVGIMVCYDLRFTPLSQLLANEGIELLLVPAAFSVATGEAHWEMLLRMRALELQAFVIGAEPARNAGLSYVPWGHSAICDPWGRVVAKAGPAEELLIAELDMAEIEHTKERFPLLRHRRLDLYATNWSGA